MDNIHDRHRVSLRDPLKLRDLSNYMEFPEPHAVSQGSRRVYGHTARVYPPLAIFDLYFIYTVIIYVSIMFLYQEIMFQVSLLYKDFFLQLFFTNSIKCSSYNHEFLNQSFIHDVCSCKRHFAHVKMPKDAFLIDFSRIRLRERISVFISLLLQS